MNRFGIMMLAAVLAVASTVTIAQAPMRIRGTITSLEGNVLNVKSREGKDLKISLPDNLAVVAAKAITFDDIRPGDFVGPASKTRPDGTLVAISVQLFPAALRGVVPEGNMPWDLEPGSVMTNANVAAVTPGPGGRELKLEYKGGSQTILVPDGTPMFTTVPGERSLLVPGAYIVTTARVGTDGVMFTQRIAVSKDGVKPAN